MTKTTTYADPIFCLWDETRDAKEAECFSAVFTNHMRDDLGYPNARAEIRETRPGWFEVWMMRA